MTDYRLTLPTVRTPIDRSSRAWRFFAIDVAQTLVREDGTWRLVRNPRDDLLQQFEAHYRGGYRHTVDQTVADELIRDGFEDCLEPI